MNTDNKGPVGGVSSAFRKIDEFVDDVVQVSIGLLIENHKLLATLKFNEYLIISNRELVSACHLLKSN